jgi:predicted methyltransferase
MIGLSAARFYHAAIGAVMLATIGTACLGVTRASAQAGAPDYAALMAAPDRSDADRQADKRRDPVPFLTFAGLRPGMKVLDMGAGAGYSTELDARAVVRRELEAAGFKLVDAGNFWRHPEDLQDFSSLVPTGPVDAFVLKFRKPM